MKREIRLYNLILPVWLLFILPPGLLASCREIWRWTAWRCFWL